MIMVRALRNLLKYLHLYSNVTAAVSPTMSLIRVQINAECLLNALVSVYEFRRIINLVEGIDVCNR